MATNVSDLLGILNRCVWIVEASNKELAGDIYYAFDSPEEAKLIGLKAKEKCIEMPWGKYYSKFSASINKA